MPKFLSFLFSSILLAEYLLSPVAAESYDDIVANITTTYSKTRLQTQSRQADIDAMRNLIKKVIEEALEERGGTIIGTWHVPQDITFKIKQETPEVKKEIVGDITETRSGSYEDTSQLADVPIYLCHAQDYSKLFNAMQEFGKERGLSMEDLSNTWPATHKQAEDLLLHVQKAADAIAFQVHKTDKNGGFEFANIPQDNYILYAALATKDQCRIWFLPSPTTPIAITKVQQVTVDFIPDNARIVWTRARKLAPSQESGFLKQAPTAQPAKRKDLMEFVPPPPPLTSP